MAGSIAIEEIKVVVSAEINKYKAEMEKMKQILDKVKKQTDDVGKQTSNSLVNSFKSAFSKIAILIGTLKLGQLLKNSIKRATEVIESENLFRTTFQQFSGEIKSWSDEVGSALGVSAYEMREQAGTIFLLTKNMGVAEKEALSMSKNLTMLAQDMASFRNMEVDEAFTKIISGMSGESEPLKRLGIIVNETSVNTWLLANGFEKVNGQFRESEKALARYNIIMASTRAEQGDLARTMDSPANAMRRFRVSLDNLKIALGNAFLPIVQIVVPILNTFVNAITRALTIFAQFTNALLGKSSSQVAKDSKEWYEYSNNVGGVADSFNDTSDAIDNVGASVKKVKGMLAGFDEINNITQEQSSGGSGGSSTGGTGSTGGGAVLPELGIGEEFSGYGEISEKVQEFVTKIKNVWGSLTDFFEEHKGTIVGILAGVWSALASIVLAVNWSAIVTTLSGYVTEIVAVITGASSVVTAPIVAIGVAIGVVIGAIVDLWVSSAEFRERIMGFVNDVKELFGGLVETLKTHFSTLVDIWTTVLLPVFDFAWDYIKELVEVWSILLVDGLWEKALKPVFSAVGELIDFIVLLFSEFWKLVKPAVESVMGLLTDFKDNHLAKISDFVKNVVGGDFSAFGELIEEVFGTIFDTVTTVLKDIKNKYMIPVGRFVRVTFGGAFTSMKNTVGKAFSLIFTKIKTTLISIKNKYMIPIGRFVRTTFGATFVTAKKIIVTAFTNIRTAVTTAKGVFNGLLTFIKGTFSLNWKTAWEGLKTIFSSVFKGLSGVMTPALNGIIEKINWVIRKVNSLASKKIPSWIPIVGGNSLGWQVPEIPLLAKGGLISEPTFAMVGEAGAEAVLPLERNLKALDMLSEKIATRIGTGNGAGTGSNDKPIEIVLKIGANEFGRVAIDSINKLQRQSGRVLLNI